MLAWYLPNLIFVVSVSVKNVFKTVLISWKLPQRLLEKTEKNRSIPNPPELHFKPVPKITKKLDDAFHFGRTPGFSAGTANE